MAPGPVYVVTVVVSVEVPSMLFTILVPARIPLILCAGVDIGVGTFGDGGRRANPSRNNNPRILLTRDDGTRHIVKTTCGALIGPLEPLFALLSLVIHNLVRFPLSETVQD
jgi:hypothetical protein